MKKLVVKTSFITLGVCLILILSLFGLLSLLVPYAMANFTSNLGLDTLSGDYAYQEYERSGDINYLARSFEIAAERGGARKADERFELLVAHEKFEEYCLSRDGSTDGAQSGSAAYRYEDYVYGQGACVKYRLAVTETEKAAVCAFALAHTKDSFPSGNPVVLLTVEAANKKDGAFCAMLLTRLRADGRDFSESTDYASIIKILEECANEQNR